MLPTLETPKYSLTIPSTKKKVTFRPFLVKEEKVLLIALESGDTKQVMSAIKGVVEACTFEKVEADSLTTFDLEYVFMKLRSKSIGEKIDLIAKCQDCGNDNEIQIDIESLSVNLPRKKVETKIQLSDSIGVICKYPTVKDIENISNEDSMSVIISCIESIFDSETVYPIKDATPEEIDSFINSLGHQHLQKISEFTNSIPKLTHESKFECPKCGYLNTHKLEGLQSFFV